MFYRKSIDTLHFGLKIEFSDVEKVVKKIKNYLFFKEFLSCNYIFCSNRFYQCETICKEFGFYMYSIPRRNCANDMITIQLTGKFFRYIVKSRHFLEKIFSEFKEVINFQRIDVALDVIYSKEEFSNVPLCSETNSLGFPLPRYSDNWKKRKEKFVTYGRLKSEYNNSFHYINMVGQGKNDVVFRVYDKTLDLLEKYKDTYSHYYSYKDNNSCFQVYRIELQARSDKLKSFIDKLVFNHGFDIINYEFIIDEFLSYIFSKYDFLMIDKTKICNTFCDTNFSVKSISSNESMMRYYKEQLNLAFQKYCLYYSAYCDDVKQLREENKQILPLIKRYNKEVVYKYCLEHASYEDFSQGLLDLEGIKEYIDFNQNKEKIPF